MFQEYAVTTNKLSVAIIEKGVDLKTNALYVGRSLQEPFIVQKGGREIAFQVKEEVLFSLERRSTIKTRLRVFLSMPLSSMR